MIRVAIADDHDIVRTGLKMILERDPQIEVVGEASDGAQAYSVTMRLKPDVLLLDISMPPGESGLTACARIARDCPKTRVIIVTMFSEPEYLYFTLRGGASGYVLKNSSASELVEAVRAASHGLTYIHPKMRGLLPESVLRDLSDRLAGGPANGAGAGVGVGMGAGSGAAAGTDAGEGGADGTDGLGEGMPRTEEDLSYQQLTDRELEILQLLALGFTNKEISERVCLSIKSVEAYRSKIYSKLGFESRSDLVAYAIRHKLFNV